MQVMGSSPRPDVAHLGDLARGRRGMTFAAVHRTLAHTRRQAPIAVVLSLAACKSASWGAEALADVAPSAPSVADTASASSTANSPSGLLARRQLVNRVAYIPPQCFTD